MSCCDYYEKVNGGATTFTVAMPKLTFGPGALSELGARLKMRGIKRVALYTDPWLATSEHLQRARDSLQEAAISFDEYAEIKIEPNDVSCLDAARFYSESKAEAAVAVGGGSVIDTAKAAVIYASHPADFCDYLGPPAGAGKPIPAPLPPIFACPTTGGTGSEATAVSVIKVQSLDTKFILQSPWMMPVEAIVDPLCASTLPSKVVASSGFDLLSHALECYTARAYTRWDAVNDPAARPTVQGANPWSDLHAREAMSLIDRYLVRAVNDDSDIEARGNMMWGATLAGMAFGNAGTHLPHAFSYGISHLAKSWHADQYPDRDGRFIPHGIAVAVNAPSVYRYIAHAAPERHLEGAQCLGADTRDGGPDDAGEIVADRIIDLMRRTDMPNGLSGVGFEADDAAALAQSAFRQRRAIANAPADILIEDVQKIYEGAVSYWNG